MAWKACSANSGLSKTLSKKASGLKVDFFAVRGRTAAVEAINADQVDFALTGPAEYVVFNARLKAQPIVVWEHPNYRSSIFRWSHPLALLFRITLTFFSGITG